MVGNYPVITLCGSTRFKEAFLEAQKRLTLEGYIVISVGLFGHSGDGEVWENKTEGAMTRTKEMLDDMHRRKIDMADEIYVINVEDYIGESTRGEIEYAREHGKIVRYLEPHVEKGTLVMGGSTGPTSYFVAGKVNNDYEEAEAFLRQTLQGTSTAGVIPADEATAAMIAYQLDEEPYGADTPHKDSNSMNADPLHEMPEGMDADALHEMPESMDTFDGADNANAAAAIVEVDDDEADPQAGKKAYVLQMLRDGYDIGNTAYFIGEDESFVRAVMRENGIREADLTNA